MNEFVTVIEKSSDNGNRSTGLSESAVRILQRKLPIAKKLIEKYSLRRSGRTIDIPIELEPFNEEDELKTVLFVKENTYRSGDIQIDIRKCAKGDNDRRFRYTADGVRLPGTLCSELAQELQRVINAIDEAVESTRKLLEMAEGCLVMKHINSLHNSTGCEGCSNDCPGQREHMDMGGCCQDWGDTVNEYFTTALTMVEGDHVTDIAEAVTEALPIVKGLVRSSVVPCLGNDEKIKQLVLEKSSMVGNVMFDECLKCIDKIMKNKQ